MLGSPVFETASSIDVLGEQASEMRDPRSTPHLERLAQRAVVFDRAYAQAPLCNPSRTSLLTSRHPLYTGVFRNSDTGWATIGADAEGPEPKLPTIVDFLKDARPEAAVVASGGKIFHSDVNSFEKGFAEIPKHSFRRKDVLQILERLPPDSYDALRDLLNRTARGDSPHRSTVQSVAALANFSTENRTFFLAQGFSLTHVESIYICKPSAIARQAGEANFSAPGSARLAVGAAWPLQPGRANDTLPPIATNPNFDLDKYLFSLSDEWRRTAVGNYFACASDVDRLIGALVDALEVFGLSRRAAVVVHSDHGFSLGRHDRWSKYSMYESSTRIPLIVAVPGGRAGREDTVVEALDIVPTILHIWGCPRRNLGGQARRSVERSLPPPQSAFEFRGKRVYLDGSSLAEFLYEAPHPPQNPRLDYARSQLRVGVQLDDPQNGKLPGAEPAAQRTIEVVELYVRSRRHSYTITLYPRCNCQEGLAVLDEALFYTTTDPGESQNTAYSPSAARELARVITQQNWPVGELQFLNASRNDRLAAFGRALEAKSCGWPQAPRCTHAQFGALGRYDNSLSRS